MISEWARQASGPPHQKNTTTCLLSQFSPRHNMSTPCKENQLLLTIQAMEKDPSLSTRSAAKIYSVSRVTLARRLSGTQSRRDSPPNSQKLTNLEEKTIVQYVLDLDSRSFPPRLCEVEDMANRLLGERDAPKVGKRWAANFIKRQPELQTRFFRRYDYKRAQCEDPEVIRG
jgi:hypothetical protein